MKALIFVAAAILCGMEAGARTEAEDAARAWTLEECIEYALEHNISIKETALQVEQKELTLNTAKNRVLPGVSASASQNFSFGRGLTSYNIYENANTTSTGLSLGAAMPLFQGLDIKNDVLMSKLDLEAATYELEKAKNDIRTRIAAAYAEILYDKEILDVAERQVAVDSMLLDRISAMEATGKASGAEVAAQKATLAQSGLTKTQSLSNYRLAILELSQLLELDSPEGFDIVCPPTESLGLRLLDNPEDIFEEALAIRPEIRSGMLKLDYAKTGIARAKGGYLPTLSLNGGLGSNYYTTSTRESDNFGTQMKNNFSQYVGLSLNVPIFSRMATKNKVKTAKLSYMVQDLEVQNTKKALYKEIQQAYYNALAAGSKMTSGQEAESSAEVSFDLTREKYENGKANITEYNESKNRWLKARSEFLQARYRYLYLTTLLDFYRGKELKF